MSSTSATTQRKIAPSTTPSSAIAAANAAKAAKETMRSARACVACRKLKTKCITNDNPDLPCKRCTANNLECVFEEIMPSVSTINARVEQLEREFQVVQAELQRLRQLESEVGAIKLLIPRAFGIPGAGDQKSLAMSGMIPSPPALPGYFAGGNTNGSVAGSTTSHAASNPSPVGLSQSLGASVRSFGGETGIRSSLPLRTPADDPVASTNVSDDEGDRDDGEDEDHLPRSVFVAPVETLNRLAEEQAQAQRRAADGSWIKPPNRKKPRRAYEPATPPDRIPDIIDKGVLDEIMARDLHAVYFSGSHRVLACFDPRYDTYDSIRKRSPFLLAAICAVGSRVQDGGGAISPLSIRLRAEVEYLAKETLFHKVEGLEMIQAMVVTSGWSSEGFLSGGLALRMAVELDVHKVFRRLAARRAQHADPNEERSLVAAARLYASLFVLDFQTSIGAGRPPMLRAEQEHSLTMFRTLLLDHPLSVKTDARVVSTAEMLMHQARITDALREQDPNKGDAALDMLLKGRSDLEGWYNEWCEIMRQRHPEEPFYRLSLDIQLQFATLFTSTIVLRGCQSFSRLTPAMLRVITMAVHSAFQVVRICTEEDAYVHGLRFAVDYTVSVVAFAGAFLLRFARLVPAVVDMQRCIDVVDRFASILLGTPYPRFAPPLQKMLTQARTRLATSSLHQLASTSLLAAAAAQNPNQAGSNHSTSFATFDPGPPSVGSADDFDWNRFVNNAFNETSGTPIQTGGSQAWALGSDGQDLGGSQAAMWSFDVGGIL
ncbi:hypothetical protein MVLG_03778 [Microbotryum lychnidis-dioicae p1A1 Lamole]|uniref:Zn(2)-C6 fungal-type domain-containing protein n=1 Tax=Microbotryum lychnidis-dioicae (strain p1A1 Lamole / MvSl-1064) TaxID=683840 RepID=U5H985_USTV1|nr:hypothetical protein MVLG_03778 [Microbotryum lychnidis-dioicae p1A1 Lamole]|eukprot:KDE05834.1 hypothetical protein MVLG_03778 [Microbotryum lychnidis-dioicae p1A1 Lamole]